MKKLLIITVLILLGSINLSATKKQLKKELQECLYRNARLDSLIKAAENNYCVTIIEPATKQDVKIKKAVEKTKRKRFKFENRKNRTNERNKTKRNIIYQIGTFAKGSTWAFVVLCTISFLMGTPVGAFVKSLFSKN